MKTSILAFLLQESILQHDKHVHPTPGQGTLTGKPVVSILYLLGVAWSTTAHIMGWVGICCHGQPSQQSWQPSCQLQHCSAMQAAREGWIETLHALDIWRRQTEVGLTAAGVGHCNSNIAIMQQQLIAKRAWMIYYCPAKDIPAGGHLSKSPIGTS